jgi:hypothetical protein
VRHKIFEALFFHESKAVENNRCHIHRLYKTIFKKFEVIAHQNNMPFNNSNIFIIIRQEHDRNTPQKEHTMIDHTMTGSHHDRNTP